MSCAFSLRSNNESVETSSGGDPARIDTGHERALTSMHNLSLALFHRPSPDALFMTLTTYIDESGSHSKSPVMVIAGYVGTVSQWSRFGEHWSGLLRRYGISHLHAVNLLHRNREFQGWSVEKSALLAEEAENICNQYTMFGFAVVMKTENYKRLYADGQQPKKIPLDTKYGVCFRACLSYLPMAIRREIKNDFDLNLILEAGHRNIGDATRLFSLFKREADPNVAQLVKTVTVADKKEFPGLQAADLVAYTTFRRENGDPEVLEFPPGQGSVEEARKFAETDSPIIRLAVTPAVLRDLKTNILSQDEARRQFRRNSSISPR